MEIRLFKPDEMYQRRVDEAIRMMDQTFFSSFFEVRMFIRGLTFAFWDLLQFIRTPLSYDQARSAKKRIEEIERMTAKIRMITGLKGLEHYTGKLWTQDQKGFLETSVKNTLINFLLSDDDFNIWKEDLNKVDWSDLETDKKYFVALRRSPQLSLMEDYFYLLEQFLSKK